MSINEMYGLFAVVGYILAGGVMVAGVWFVVIPMIAITVSTCGAFRASRRRERRDQTGEPHHPRAS